MNTNFSTHSLLFVLPDFIYKILSEFIVKYLVK
jgi:hypothetical protein